MISVGQLIHQRSMAAEHQVCPFKRVSPRVRQMQGAGGALKQANLEGALQRGQPACGQRGRDIELPGGRGDRLGPRDGDKQFEQLQVNRFKGAVYFAHGLNRPLY